MELLFDLEGALKALFLVVARTSALVLSAPVLGYGLQFSGYKVAIIMLTSLVIYVAIGEPLPPDVDSVQLLVMMVREILIGLFLGLLLLLLLLVVRVAGDMIGHEMGFMMARQVDPVSGVDSTLIVSFYEYLFLLSFLMLDGHHLLIRALGESFVRAPLGQVTLSGGVAMTFQAMFSEMFGAGIVFAAPVMIFLMLVSILLGLLARSVSTLNVLELGFSIRVVVALLALFVFAPLLEPAMLGLHGRFVDWLSRGLDALG